MEEKERIIDCLKLARELIARARIATDRALRIVEEFWKNQDGEGA